jgi:hypothetical protein
MNASAAALVQVGATRDGLDPYRGSAATRDMPAVLVETPAYLAWRRRLGRGPFDREIAVERPHQPEQVIAALRAADVTPAVLLAGFERYAAAAFDAATALSVPPNDGRDRPPFRAPDKARLRATLAELAPDVRQPRHALAGQDGREAAIPYPRVVKPVDGGGGLGVFLVRNTEEDRHARHRVIRTDNYGGGSFTGTLVEEYVAGTEFSVQGVARHGQAHVLSVCEKVVQLEPQPDGLCGFREAGHLMLPPAAADSGLLALAQTCLKATGYHDGPFHLDAIVAHTGTLYFVEMGFRLSGGGLVALAERALGVRWADLALAAHLGDPSPFDAGTPPAGGAVFGQLACTRAHQLRRAEQLRRSGAPVDVTPAAAVPPLASLDPAHVAALASDRQRHAVVLGRVVVRADDTEGARQLLIDCATAQGEDVCADSSSLADASKRPPSSTPHSE